MKWNIIDVRLIPSCNSSNARHNAPSKQVHWEAAERNATSIALSPSHYIMYKMLQPKVPLSIFRIFPQSQLNSPQLIREIPQRKGSCSKSEPECGPSGGSHSQTPLHMRHIEERTGRAQSLRTIGYRRHKEIISPFRPWSLPGKAPSSSRRGRT